MNKEGYRKFVFDEENRRFIGNFDKMYATEKKENYDSWYQDDISFLDKQICLQILNQYNFKTLIDIGCGKGALSHLMKTKGNKVFGFDISKQGINIANKRYPDIDFFTMDIQQADWTNILYKELENKSGGGVDCIVCLETLSYIETWQRVIKFFSAIGQFTLIKLFIPDNPIGYVKSGDSLVGEFNKHFDIVEHIEFISKNMVILFGKSKLIVGK